MDQNESELQSLLDNLAMELVLLEYGDLAGLGKLLSNITTIKDAAAVDGQINLICRALEAVVEFAILEQGHQAAKMVPEVLSSGVTLLQDLTRGTDKDDEIKEYLARLRDIFGLPEMTSEEPAAEPVCGLPAANLSEHKITDKETCYEFITEAADILGEVEKHLLDLESDPDNTDMVNAVFRAFHTVKGVSGFINLVTTNTFAHHLENLLDKVREGEMSMTPQVVDLILESVDVINNLLKQLKDNLACGLDVEPQLDLAPYLERIDHLIQGKGVVPEDEPVLPPKEDLPDQEQILVPETKPILLPKENMPLGEMLVEMGAITYSDIDQTLQSQEMKEEGRLFGEVLVEKGLVSAGVVNKALNQQKAVEVEAQETIKVGTEKLDYLVDMVGELVIAQSMVSQDIAALAQQNQRLSREFNRLTGITSEIQRTAMSLRMVPIKMTFQKVSRLVRDLARKSNKKINFVTTGEETELDRKMVDKIYEPMVHLIRNSVDHGIEDPDDRVRAGKPATGLISLNAFHQGGKLMIEIKDDGRGLNHEKIIRKAVEKGLIQEGAELSEKEIFLLIFAPGFSTAEKITDVSGRGVGMDVVQNVVNELRGQIEIESSQGQGTSFMLRFPLTLAIIDGIIVGVGKERYIIPTLSVVESFRPNQADIITVQKTGETIKLRNGLLPLIRLNRLFNIHDSITNPTEGLVVVVENEATKRCLLVDTLIGKQEVVIKSMGEAFNKLKGIAGGAIMGDGRIGLIIDVAGLFECANRA
ncbi:MAG: chemotaxis protein CheA [Deltaproteobacteria bacterium]|nr:chemotaxis protein CheA [Deltaproteobacteria bacterium]